VYSCGQTGTTNARPVKGGRRARPDGTEIAFVTAILQGDDRIFVIRPDGSGLRELTRHRSGDDESPARSPDGRKIAFARGHLVPAPGPSPARRKFQLDVMNADGTDPHPLNPRR